MPPLASIISWFRHGERADWEFNQCGKYSQFKQYGRAITCCFYNCLSYTLPGKGAGYNRQDNCPVATDALANNPT